jgi:hypothetical protein
LKQATALRSQDHARWDGTEKGASGAATLARRHSAGTALVHKDNRKTVATATEELACSRPELPMLDRRGELHSKLEEEQLRQKRKRQDTELHQKLTLVLWKWRCKELHSTGRDESVSMMRKQWLMSVWYGVKRRLELNLGCDGKTVESSQAAGQRHSGEGKMKKEGANKQRGDDVLRKVRKSWGDKRRGRGASTYVVVRPARRSRLTNPGKCSIKDKEGAMVERRVEGVWRLEKGE